MAKKTVTIEPKATETEPKEIVVNFSFKSDEGAEAGYIMHVLENHFPDLTYFSYREDSNGSDW